MTGYDATRLLLGSYLLGALDPAERDQVDRHLAGCADCRTELASYAGLPGLMARLTLEEASGPALTTPPSLLPSTLAAVTVERSMATRRLHRWRTAAVGSGLAATAAAAFVLVLVVGGGSHRASRPMVAAAGTASTGSVSFTARPWGTELRLRLHGLPRTGTFTAWTLDAAGTPTVAATWGATATGDADVTGATSLRPAQLADLRVTTDGKRVLLVSRA